MVRLPGLPRPGESSTKDLLSFGHAAIWRLVGDPYPDDPDSPVAMSSWGIDPDPVDPQHERNGVGYDYRRHWARSAPNTTYYGLRVINNSGSDTSNYVATQAEQYAEVQRALRRPYNYAWWDKWRTDSFYCSQLVWRCWFNQGYDIDSGDFMGGVVEAATPEEIYLDNNTRYMYYWWSRY